MRSAAFLLLGLSLGACGDRPASVEEAASKDIGLPGGRAIHAELALTPDSLERGLMFRESLPAGRGMLFVFPSAGRYPFWMFQTRIPLDIIWIDTARRIVEISVNTPPCPGSRATCPSYGGSQEARFVLEIAGGMAAKYGLKTGDTLTF